MLLEKAHKWSLLLYIASLPLSIAGMEIFSWLSFLIGTLFLISSSELRKQITHFHFKPLLYALPFVALVMIGALVNSGITADKKIFIIGEMRWIFLLTLLPIFLSRYQGHWEMAFKVLAIILGIMGIYSTIQVFTGIDIVHKDPYLPLSLKTIWRAKGFFDIMTYSYAISTLSLYLLAALELGWLPKFRKILIACAACCFLSLLLTFTRGMWLSLILSSLWVTWLVNRKWAQILGGVIASCFIVLSISIPEFRIRVVNLIVPNDYSSLMRIKMWLANWEMFLDHPWFGVGFRQNVFHIETYYHKIGVFDGLVSHAHSNYFAILAGVGLPGILAYLFFIGAFYWLGLRLWWQREKLNRSQQVVVLGALGAMLNFHLGGVTEATFYDGEIVHIYVISMALLIAINNDVQKIKDQKYVT